MAHGNFDDAPSGSNGAKKSVKKSVKKEVTNSETPLSGTITRADLAEAVQSAVGLPRGQAAECVELVLSEIFAALVGGEDVKLASFGVFHLREKKERAGRNPKTGADAIIAARRVVVFKASTILRGKINGDRRDED